MSESDYSKSTQPVLREGSFTRLKDLTNATASRPSTDDESSSATPATTNETVRNRAQDTNGNMIATQVPLAIGGHGDMFPGCGQGKHPAVVQGELQQLKSSPMLNPHYRMIQRYIDCLNWYIDVCVSSQGAAGIRTWMYEVQLFKTAVQKRAYQRMPLTMEERHAIIQFTSFWRQQISSPYFMGRPEAQVILFSLAEVAQS